MVSFTDLNSSLFYVNAAAAGQIGQTGQFLITGTLNINDTSTNPQPPSPPNLVSYRGAIIGIPPGSSGPTPTSLSINGTGSTRNHVLNLDNASLVSAINSPNSLINARDTAFGTTGPISIIALSYGLIDYSNISNGMTISELPRNLIGNGAGIYSSTISGTFTGPAGGGSNQPWLLDGATNYWRYQNGATMIGGVEVLFNSVP
jgi:hypothetical protein